mmetsp:Transcript_15196/g.35616  ORF Transcript_15196/g.35616 Transcript_15196/m.35616 type:complete len:97 (-) Transcript_15196:1098-1388(-)
MSHGQGANSQGFALKLVLYRFCSNLNPMVAGHPGHLLDGQSTTYATHPHRPSGQKYQTPCDDGDGHDDDGGDGYGDLENCHFHVQCCGHAVSAQRS